MADKKTEMMACFYEECQKCGYTDMQDATQSLKAKVIAVDMGLNYGNIVSFYEKARRCHGVVLQERADREAKEADLQREKAEEAARRAVDGMLLATLSDRWADSDGAVLLRVYIRPDGTVYSTVDDGGKLEGAPVLRIRKAGAVLLTYRPPKTIYTGVTIGPVTTGTVHSTQEGYAASINDTGKGYIEAAVGSRTIELERVILSEHTCEAFKRDGEFCRLVKAGEIKCHVASEKAKLYYDSILPSMSSELIMNALSIAAEEQRLTVSACKEILELLGRIVNGQFPPTDEQIYTAALKASKAGTAKELENAYEMMRQINGYKDADSQAAEIKDRYEEVLQLEKEQAVIDRERRRKRIPLIVAVGVILLALLAAGVVFLLKQREKQREEMLELAYASAVERMEAGDYTEAIEGFGALGDFRNSTVLIAQCEQHILFQEGISFLEDHDYKSALSRFRDWFGEDREKYISYCELALELKTYLGGDDMTALYRQITDLDGFLEIETLVRKSDEMSAFMGLQGDWVGTEVEATRFTFSDGKLTGYMAEYDNDVNIRTLYFLGIREPSRIISTKTYYVFGDASKEEECFYMILYCVDDDTIHFDWSIFHCDLEREVK